MTPERFATGMSFADYVKFLGSPENLGREGFDLRAFRYVRPRVDWSTFFSDRYARVRLSAEQAAALSWLTAQPGGPAKIFVIAEDWSSDCRRDLPLLARMAEAGGLELRIFLRDGDAMWRDGLPDPAAGGNADLVNEYALEKRGQRWAAVPVVVFFSRDFVELYRYIEHPAAYARDRLIGHIWARRPGESEEQYRLRCGRETSDLLETPFVDLWGCAAVDEMLSALHVRLVLG